ncbi:MAG: hypothetical protein ACREFP_26910 [Acetobacteraceae bacterium]
MIEWLLSAIPSNTLTSLHGLPLDIRERQALGEGIDLQISALDETNTRIRPVRTAGRIKRGGELGLVAPVDVQSNQYPRAMDFARPLREVGILVAIGGFHASGCIAMLPGIPPDLQAALDCGIPVFAGEAEGRLEQVLLDALGGRLAPIYNFMEDLPGLEGAPPPCCRASGSSERVGGSPASMPAAAARSSARSARSSMYKAANRDIVWLTT